MFSRRSHSIDPSTRQRSGRAGGSRKQRSFKDSTGVSKSNLKTSLSQKVDVLQLAAQQQQYQQQQLQQQSPPVGENLTSPVVTLVVGREQRIFAAHENVLAQSPYFAAACRGQILEAGSRRINLPEEEPDVLSSILEYLYKGDYYPRLIHSKRRNTWHLEDATYEDGTKSAVETMVISNGVCGAVLKDTVIYCTAAKYGLDELKSLALRKQGLQAGIQVGTILTSARYAYANTNDNDSKLRAHYLSLIIRCRDTFKRSGSMQAEMEMGGALFFDLFVALCNHCDDLATNAKKSPR
ncbi:MAG: hypothetical protein M1814_001849 [Vezdaea aestivalis]|nr:MAG: hypothetical protein M1814_001849 [Vezdaea aestivalis]